MNDLMGCDYCHSPVSVFEGITEFGKWFHDKCYIHRTQKEIEGYKKKWINKTMTDGDKVDLVDKFNLVEKLKTEKMIFRGHVPVFMKTHKKEIKEKIMLCLDKSGIPILDENGKPVYVDELVIIKEVGYVTTRPHTQRIKTGYKPKLLTIENIPALMESMEK